MNQRNRRRNCDNTTGAVGVYRHKRRFCARITTNGVTQHLGYFDTIEEAAAAYRRAADALGYSPRHGCAG